MGKRKASTPRAKSRKPAAKAPPSRRAGKTRDLPAGAARTVRGGTDDLGFRTQSTLPVSASYEASAEIAKQEHKSYMTIIKNLKA